MHAKIGTPGLHDHRQFSRENLLMALLGSELKLCRPRQRICATLHDLVELSGSLAYFTIFALLVGLLACLAKERAASTT